MRKLFLLTLVIGIILTGCTSIQYKNPEALVFPKLHIPETPSYIQEHLDNGMVVFLMEDRSLPLIRFQALIRTGSIYEPGEKTGLAEITLETLRTGGAGDMSGDEIDAVLENIGASITSGAGRDIASILCLSSTDNFPLVFDIFYSMLTKPCFQQDKIDLCTLQKKAGISRRDDDISETADREFRKLVYGKDSWYARIPEYETLNNITRDDIVSFHKKYFYPENIILGIWGDFDSYKMLETVRNKCGGWQRGGIIYTELPPVEFPPGGYTHLIERKDVTQSVIVMGHRGIRRDHPDYCTALVLSRILGAGHYSRFSRILRQEKGLAYEIWAGFITEFNYPGIFIAKAQTQQERTSEVIKMMKQEIESIKKGVTDGELSVAKEGILNSEVFWSDTKDKIITRLMYYQYYGYPLDYQKKLMEGVKKVTKEDVVRVAKELLFPEDLIILIVGNT